MNVLCVAPNSSGSGEAITAAHVAAALIREGHAVTAFASAFTARFFSPPARVESFATTPEETGVAWRRLLRETHPDVVLFADYALLPLSLHGQALLSADSAAVLQDTAPALVTFDHLGLGQGPLTVGFGPPHLDLLPASIPALPKAMDILLPCPVQSPTTSATRRGTPCRYWPATEPLSSARRQAMRDRYTGSRADRLVLHATPGWALEYCRQHSLPQPRFLGRCLAELLAGLAGPITIVCVNAADLPEISTEPNLRIVRSPQLAAAEYDDLLLASDLMLTDNAVSVGLGKAVCGGVDAAAVRNSLRLSAIVAQGGSAAALALDLEAARPGSVFPFEVFPIWSRADVDRLGVFNDNPFATCVTHVEQFGGATARATLEFLLFDDGARTERQARGEAYAHAVRALPAAHELLAGCGLG